MRDTNGEHTQGVSYNDPPENTIYWFDLCQSRLTVSPVMKNRTIKTELIMESRHQLP